jgi:hypothetical protein
MKRKSTRFSPSKLSEILVPTLLILLVAVLAVIIVIIGLVAAGVLPAG